MDNGENLPAVILAGGLGTRLREETEFKPKPMVEIGGRPILWHIMKQLSTYGVSEFIICLGYKGDVIKDYFLNYEKRNNDISVNLGQGGEIELHGEHEEDNWKVTLAQTGDLTGTGGRIHRIQKYVDGRKFLCTYGDGVADTNINELLSFHNSHKGIATVTAVQPETRFGVLDVDHESAVLSFLEKPKSENIVNAGFFVFEPEVFTYLSDDCVLEQEPLHSMSRDRSLFAYRHNGFWQPMDTFREVTLLNEMWNNEAAPWKVW
jgi:glucose-1-phosphate cytidylyltransferase